MSEACCPLLRAQKDVDLLSHAGLDPASIEAFVIRVRPEDGNYEGVAERLTIACSKYEKPPF